MDTLRITKNQPFVLYVPLVILNADGSKEIVQAASLSDIYARVQAVCGSEHQVLPEKYENFLVFEFPGDMTVGEYNILINAKLDTDREFSLYLKKAFAVVNWDYESNWQDYLVGDHIVCAQSFIAGVFNTDADYERLKGQLQREIVRLRELQAEWLAKIAEVTDVAQQTTLVEGIASVLQGFAPLATTEQLNTVAQNILTAISHIDIDTTTLAKEQTLTNGIQSILTALNPKATTADVTAAKQAILDALSHISPEDPYSQALAAFFNITPPVPNAVPMTQQEVEDDLDELWNLIITQ